MAQVFATRALGFPSYVKDQLQTYISDQSGLHLTSSEDSSSDEVDPERSLSDGEAGNEEDDDWHGPSKSHARPESGDQAQLPKFGHALNSQPLHPRPQDFVPVSQLRAYVVTEDPEMPNVQPVRSVTGSVTFHHISVVGETTTNTTTDWTTSQTSTATYSQHPEADPNMPVISDAVLQWIHALNHTQFQALDRDYESARAPGYGIVGIGPSYFSIGLVNWLLQAAVQAGLSDPTFPGGLGLRAENLGDSLPFRAEQLMQSVADVYSNEHEQTSQSPSPTLQYDESGDDDSVLNEEPRPDARHTPLQMSVIDGIERARLLNRLQDLSENWPSHQVRRILPVAAVLLPWEIEQTLVLLDNGHSVLGIQNLYATAERLEVIKGLVTQGLPHATTTENDVSFLIETIKFIDIGLGLEEIGNTGNESTNSEDVADVLPLALSRPPPSSIDSDTRVGLILLLRTLHEHFGNTRGLETQLETRRRLMTHLSDSEARIEALPPGQLLRPSEIQQLDVLLESTLVDDLDNGDVDDDDHVARESHVRALVARGLPINATRSYDIGYLGFMVLTIHERLQDRARQSIQVSHVNDEAGAEDSDDPMDDLFDDLYHREGSEDGESDLEVHAAANILNDTATSQAEARPASLFRTNGEDDARESTGEDDEDDGPSWGMVAFDARMAEVRR